MITLDLAPPARRVHRYNYTGMLTAALEEWVSTGLQGAALGAIEVAASMIARAFSVAGVSPTNSRTAGLTPEVLGTVGRRMIAAGESVHVLDVVDGGVVLHGGGLAFSVHGGRPPWRYQITYTGPEHDRHGMDGRRPSDPLPIRDARRATLDR